MEALKGLPPPVLLPWRGTEPLIAPGTFVAPGVVIVGDVQVGAASSIWFGSVVRGDMYYIRIGERTSIQDGCVLHVRSGECPTVVGDDVTVGHRVILHGCTIGSGALVGMGATILDRAIVGERAMVAAGSLVTPGMEVPAGTLAIGSPARVKRQLTDEELDMMRQSSRRYVDLAAEYLALLAPAPAPSGS